MEMRAKNPIDCSGCNLFAQQELLNRAASYEGMLRDIAWAIESGGMKKPKHWKESIEYLLVNGKR